MKSKKKVKRVVSKKKVFSKKGGQMIMRDANIDLKSSFIVLIIFARPSVFHIDRWIPLNSFNIRFK